MKKIEAIIRIEQLDEVLDALEKIGESGLMVTEIKGHGKQKGLLQQWRGEEYKLGLINKMKLEMIVKDDEVSKIKEAIIKSAKTGEIGDGKIFVYTIDDAVKIRTGETGDSAL